MKKERREISISLLKVPELNTRIHPVKQIAEIRRSLQKWGQYKNVVVDDKYTLLAGNGLVEAMKQEGLKKVWAVILYDLTENEKKKLMMSDNKTAGLGVDNLDNIEKLIHDLDGDFDIPGFDDEILNSIAASSEEITRALESYGKASDENLASISAHAGINDEAEAGDEPTGGEDLAFPAGERATITCPKCGEVICL